jgi:hypothetical protein
MHPECVIRLNTLARKNHCSKNSIIRAVILREVSRLHGAASSGMAVQYQPSSGVELRRIHIFLDPDLYEACLDLRKFSKKSLSFIISLAIMRESQAKGFQSDNYQFKYDVFSVITNGTTHYVIKHQLEKKQPRLRKT